jgi:hypothetical protein
VFQTLITIAEASQIPLSTETEAALVNLRQSGFTFDERGTRPPSRPLAEAPTGPTEFSVFVDESGTASYEEASQPVLCLVGVIIRDDAIPLVESAAERVLTDRGLPPSLEFHAQEFLSRDGPLGSLEAQERHALLRQFVEVGMAHVSGVHQMPKLKAMVRPERRKMAQALGLNAYSETVLFFALTLDRACLAVTTPAQYKYFYDRTDAHRGEIEQIFRTLGNHPNRRLRLIALKGRPTQLESHQNRLIQLADVVGYYLNRYRQLEIPTDKPRAELLKHQDEIMEVYGLIRPRLVDFIGKDLYRMIDWQALQSISLEHAGKDRRRMGRSRGK